LTPKKRISKYAISGGEVMSMTYAEWKERPSRVNDAECMELFGYHRWDDEHEREWWRKMDGDRIADLHRIEFSPTTDRNATAMLVEEVKRRWPASRMRFAHILTHELVLPSEGTMAAGVIAGVSADPSLVAWACVEACKGGAS
jgi:hypothetical protein